MSPKEKEAPLQDALLEIGTEEIPASYIPPALEHMISFMRKALEAKNLAFASMNTYGTPRRLALELKGLPAKSPATSEEVWGPSLKAAKDASGQWTQAAKGFAQSHKVGVDQLQVKPNKKGDYLCVVKQHAGLKAEDVLSEAFAALLASIPFPKRMVWEPTRFRFARPVRNLVALYGKKTLKLSVAGIKASSKTFALSHMSSKTISIPSASQYLTALKNQCILVSPAARKEAVLNAAAQLARKVGGSLKEDPDLLEEVIWLVEHPVPVLGNFDASFLELPQEVLTTCMKKHQKFFSVLDGGGKILPHFIAVRNGISEHQNIVREGYEKVLTARLSDAKFFFEQDVKKPLEAHMSKCSGILLQEKLGSIVDKTERMKAVARFCVETLHGATSNGQMDPQAIDRAIQLSKFDLATQMVYEFPELQGTMGGIYAERFGESPRVASAIQEHYYPITVQGELPRSADASIVALADKIDGLAGNFAIGRVPSGSADPYGLRRQSTGILRIILEKQWPMALRPVVQHALSQFKGLSAPQEATGQVLAFLSERFQLLLQDSGLELDEVNAVVRNAGHPDVQDLQLLLLRQKALALHEVRRHPDFEAVAGAYKRAANILRQAREKQIAYSPESFSAERLNEGPERGLHETLSQVEKQTRLLMADRKYRETLQEWVKLRPSLDLFFDKVMVMDPDTALRDNRLSLLSRFEAIFKEVADFSQLQNKTLQQ